MILGFIKIKILKNERKQLVSKTFQKIKLFEGPKSANFFLEVIFEGFSIELELPVFDKTPQFSKFLHFNFSEK